MKKRLGAAFFLTPVAAIYLLNASWNAGASEGALQIVSHRGVHQTFDSKEVDANTCTAAIIDPPSHHFIENTTESMKAAFDYGADAVEVDVHATVDGEFVVFHDWTVDCRTEGEGVTRELTSAYLKTLDVGYGYTADGGATWPLRGKGVGAMPLLREVFSEFPEGRFVINVKGNKSRDAEPLLGYLNDHALSGQVLAIVSGPSFAGEFNALSSQIRASSRKTVKACLQSYLLRGWTGFVPSECAYGVAFPQNLAPLLWGWPKRFSNRFGDRDYFVMMVGPLSANTQGVDTPEGFARVPLSFRGAVMTNKIEIIGPLRAQRAEEAAKSGRVRTKDATSQKEG